MRRPPDRLQRGPLRVHRDQGRRAVPGRGDRRREAELSPGTARALTLSGALVDARECLRLGVFDEVVAPDEVIDRAVALAAELAAVNAGTYARTKAQLRGAALDRMRTAAGSDPLSQPDQGVRPLEWG